MGILIGSPFIQQNDVALLRQSQQQRHAFLLPFRQFQIEDTAIAQLQLVPHLQMFQPLRDQLRISLFTFRPQQFVEQPDVSIDRSVTSPA